MLLTNEDIHKQEYTGEHVIGEIIYVIENNKAVKYVITDLWNDGKNGFYYEEFENPNPHIGYWVYEE